jgi:hypothetical protein
MQLFVGHPGCVRGPPLGADRSNAEKHNDFGKVLFKKQENSMVFATFVDLSVGARSLTYRKGLLRTRFFLGVARWPGQLPGGTWTDQLGRGMAPSLVLQGPALAPQRAQ